MKFITLFKKCIPYMPDINVHIEFSETQSALIESKLCDPAFAFSDWGCDELQELRATIRNFYRTQQRGICSYCKNPVSIQSASNCHIEHIVPKSKYRAFIFEPKNFCVICADCNEIKREQETTGEIIDTVSNGDKRIKYPRSSGAFKISHPHFDNFDDHILVLSGKYYLDKSRKGNFTIYACRLNRRLYEFGWEKEIVDESIIFDLMNKWQEEKSFTIRTDLINQLKRLLLQV